MSLLCTSRISGAIWMDTMRVNSRSVSYTHLKRREAEVELGRLENELKQKLLEIRG